MLDDLASSMSGLSSNDNTPVKKQKCEPSKSDGSEVKNLFSDDE